MNPIFQALIRRPMDMAIRGSSGRASRREQAARWGVAGLAGLGAADALYMLAYTGGLISSLRCPFFGEGCNIVGRSSHAEHLGVPNSAVGVVGYAAMAAMALWAGDRRPEDRPWPLLGLATTSLAAFGASLFLTWEMATKVRAWCFWCLSSAAINTLILPVAFWEGWRALRSLR